MRIDRSTFRAGVGIAAGVALGLLAPMLPALGASSPPTTCESQLVGAASRVADARNTIAGRLPVPGRVESQLVSAESRLIGVASRVCGTTSR